MERQSILVENASTSHSLFIKYVFLIPIYAKITNKNTFYQQKKPKKVPKQIIFFIFATYLKTELINLKYKIMKKILFVSAAALALVLSSCKKETPAQVEAPTQVEETVDAAAEATAEAAATVENAVLKGLEESLNAIKAEAENASKEDVAGIVAKITELKAQYESAKANLNADEQAGFEAAVNAVIEILKTKN